MATHPTKPRSEELDGAAVRIHAHWQQGCQIWPRVRLSEEMFARYVRERWPAQVPSDLCAADLYLACACAACLDGSAEAFDACFLKQVPALVKHMDLPATLVDELLQRLREKLLVCAGPSPRIVGYSGRGPLLSFVRVVAVRAALDLLREQGRASRPRLDPGAVLHEDPEIAQLRARYRDDVAAAVRDACLRLDADAASLLRMQLAGLSTTRIAALLGVTQPAIVQRLQRARARVLQATRRLLNQRIQARDSELTSLLRVVRSDLDVSLSRFLQR